MLEDSVGYQLKRVQHALRARMDEALRELDLTTPQYSALSVVQQEPGLSGNKIAGRCFVTAQTMNLILANLEERKLIVRRPHPEFGRVLQAYLTEEGERRVWESNQLVRDIEARMISHLSEERAVQLAHELGQCADVLGTAWATHEK
jgi:DNA-binding MarR family transcriptional regulator